MKVILKLSHALWNSKKKRDLSNFFLKRTKLAIQKLSLRETGREKKKMVKNRRFFLGQFNHFELLVRPIIHCFRDARQAADPLKDFCPEVGRSRFLSMECTFLASLSRKLLRIFLHVKQHLKVSKKYG